MAEDKPILVIDDEEIVLVSIRKILTGEGYRVETVTSPLEGLDLLKKTSCGMVITDLKMPEMTGLELIEEIKNEFPALPILMITGYATVKTAIQALRMGAIDYFAKPFRRQELIGAVHRALRKSESSAGSTREDNPENESTDTKRKEHVDDVGILLPGDRFVLPGHSWAQYQQEGTLLIGCEEEFLQSVGKISIIKCPEINALIEQGINCAEIIDSLDEEHHVFAPVSGRIMDVNSWVMKDPDTIDSETWLVQVVPSNLREELTELKRSPKN
jgi:FixJ family two-component response regulator/glycine cleavage system H lipoate-binding protein